MSVPNKTDNSLSNLLYGIILVLFGSFALLVAWAMWLSIFNWLILMFALISFVAPAFAAFFLGFRRLILFVTFYTSMSNPKQKQNMSHKLPLTKTGVY